MNLLPGKCMEMTMIILTTIGMSLVAVIIGASDTYASTLSLEDPPLQVQNLTLTADGMDRDISIEPYTDFNSTQEISTAGATDIDINNIPPAGVSVIITNETIMVTKELSFYI